jgi:hypothetical protein
MSEPLHPTCVETTDHAGLWAGIRSYMCGVDCPRPAGPDAARDARVAKRRAEDARAAARALDRLFAPYGYRVVEQDAADHLDCGWNQGGPCTCGMHEIAEGV